MIKKAPEGVLYKI